MSIFSYSLLSKILKLRRSSLKLFFLKKIVYNQFPLLKNFLLKFHMIYSHYFGIRCIWLAHKATNSQLEWSKLKFYKVWNKKKGVWKRGKHVIIEASRIFETALEGGRESKGGGNGSFAWESFTHSMLLSW